MEKLKRSNDRKVSNRISSTGKSSLLCNTFGLPSGKSFSCPGQTSICELVCYAGKLEKRYINLHGALFHNYNLLKNASLQEKIRLLDNMISEFESECEKWNVEKFFRIHWDGDFFDVEYTVAWSKVITMHPEIQFWAYTRSWFSVAELYQIKNLSLYFSTDSDNMQTAVELKKLYNVNLAFLDNNFSDGQEKLSQITNKRAIRCPENNGRIPLISEKGSACGVCGACIYGRGDILFSVTKK